MFKDYPDDISFKDATEFTMTVEGDFSKLYEILGIDVPKKDDNLEELKNACETATDAIKTINRIMSETISAQASEAYDFSSATSKKSVKEWENILGIKHSLLNTPFTSENKDQEYAELKKACDIVERHNLCYNSPSDVCFAKSCKECNHYQDPNVVYKAVVQLLEHAKKSLNDSKDVDNRYIRNVTGGVELYDDAEKYVGYVHGFKGVKSEADIRSIVQNSWGLLTLNPFTLEKIIEDHGYVADIHFIVEMYKDYSDIQLPRQWYLVKRKAKEESK